MARRRLSDAVHALADRQPQWIDGVCRWADPLYTRLRGSMRGAPMQSGRRVPDSRLPCRTDILTWLIDVDMTVAEWQPQGSGTVDRLYRLQEKPYRPEDCELLDSYREQLVKWTTAATDMLGDVPPTVPLRLPCPACSSTTAHRRDGAGDYVRVPALQLSEAGCVCLKCAASWPPDKFHFLASLLGCKPLLSA